MPVVPLDTRRGLQSPIRTVGANAPGQGPAPTPQAQPSETHLLMALATMHQLGRIPKAEGEYQVAANEPKPPVSIRSQGSLENAIRNADSDEELQSIKKRLDKRGYSTDQPTFEGLK